MSNDLQNKALLNQRIARQVWGTSSKDLERLGFKRMSLSSRMIYDIISEDRYPAGFTINMLLLEFNSDFFTSSAPLSKWVRKGRLHYKDYVDNQYGLGNSKRRYYWYDRE